MADTDWQTELAEMLAERGHTPPEIEKIMARVLQYETQMQVDSVMDSIAGGQFDLGAIIAEALQEPRQQV